MANYSDLRARHPTAPALQPVEADSAEAFAAEVMRLLSEYESELLRNGGHEANASTSLADVASPRDQFNSATKQVIGDRWGADSPVPGDDAGGLSARHRLHTRAGSLDLPLYQQFSSPGSMPLHGYSHGVEVLSLLSLSPEDNGSRREEENDGSIRSPATGNGKALQFQGITAEGRCLPVDHAIPPTAEGCPRPIASSPGASREQHHEDHQQEQQEIQGAALDTSTRLPLPPPKIVVHFDGDAFAIPSHFGVVEPHLYRSCFPSPEHYPFLARLRIRTVINLLDSFPEEYREFVREQGILYAHLPVKGNKAHCEEMDRRKALVALSMMTDNALQPVLVHCRSGKHRTGALVGCLRMLQRWSLADACEEYIGYCQHKQREVDKQYIERFQPLTLRDMLPQPQRLVPWLPDGCCDHPSALQEAIARGELRPSDAELGLAPLPSTVITKPGHPDEDISPAYALTSLLRASFRATASVGRASALGLAQRVSAIALAVSGGGAGSPLAAGSVTGAGASLELARRSSISGPATIGGSRSASGSPRLGSSLGSTLAPLGHGRAVTIPAPGDAAGSESFIRERLTRFSLVMPPGVSGLATATGNAAPVTPRGAAAMRATGLAGDTDEHSGDGLSPLSSPSFSEGAPRAAAGLGGPSSGFSSPDAAGRTVGSEEAASLSYRSLGRQLHPQQRRLSIQPHFPADPSSPAGMLPASSPLSHTSSAGYTAESEATGASEERSSLGEGSASSSVGRFAPQRVVHLEGRAPSLLRPSRGITPVSYNSASASCSDQGLSAQDATALSARCHSPVHASVSLALPGAALHAPSTAAIDGSAPIECTSASSRGATPAALIVPKRTRTILPDGEGRTVFTPPALQGEAATPTGARETALIS